MTERPPLKRRKAPVPVGQHSRALDIGMALGDDSDGQKGKSHGSTPQIPVLLTLGGCAGVSAHSKLRLVRYLVCRFEVEAPLCFWMPTQRRPNKW
jgi:hypothetical protein